MNIAKKSCCGFIVLTLFFISCGDNNYVESTYSVKLPSFHEMDLNSVFEVYLVNDTSFSIRVTGHEEIIKKIRFSVEAGVLSISNVSKGKWLNPEANRVKLYVNANQLQIMHVNETCYIETIDPIVSENFYIGSQSAPKLSHINIEVYTNSFVYWNTTQCGGKLTLRGRTDNLELHIFSLMAVDARRLSASHASVQNSSKGDCEVYIEQKLEYSIHDTGNIYLYGSPGEIILNERTSTGKLIPVE